MFTTQRLSSRHLSLTVMRTKALLFRSIHISTLYQTHKQFLDLVADCGDGEIFYNVTDRWIELKLSNPKKKNAISGRMMSQMAIIIDNVMNYELQNSSVIGITVEGESDTFCAGADFELVKNVVNTPEIGHSMSLFMTDALSTLYNCPLISVAKVNGPALGGGAEVAIACDFRVMSQNSYVQFVHAKMGVVPGWGGVNRLVSIVGRRTALKLLGSCPRISPAEAMQLGLADAIESQSESMDAVMKQFLEPYSSQRFPMAVNAIKSIVSATSILPHSEAKTLESNIFRDRWAGYDNKIALKDIK